MPIVRSNVKVKRYKILSSTGFFSWKRDHLLLKNTALFPLHLRQNWLNTLPPLFALRSDESVGKAGADQPREKQSDQQQAQHWDRRGQGWSRMLAAPGPDQESGKT